MFIYSKFNLFEKKKIKETEIIICIINQNVSFRTLAGMIILWNTLLNYLTKRKLLTIFFCLINHAFSRVIYFANF